MSAGSGNEKALFFQRTKLFTVLDYAEFSIIEKNGYFLSTWLP